MASRVGNDLLRLPQGRHVEQGRYDASDVQLQSDGYLVELDRACGCNRVSRTSRTRRDPEGPPGVGAVNGLREFPDSSSWQAPPGITHVMVYAIGSGGGGGLGLPACSDGDGPSGGGMGGDGGFVASAIAVVPGDTYTVQVGAGGGGASTGDSATPGSDTEFIAPGGTVLVDAQPGQPGGNTPPGCTVGGVEGLPGSATASGTSQIFVGGGSGSCPSWMPNSDPSLCGQGGSGEFPGYQSTALRGNSGDVVLEW